MYIHLTDLPVEFTLTHDVSQLNWHTRTCSFKKSAVDTFAFFAQRQSIHLFFVFFVFIGPRNSIYFETNLRDFSHNKP